MEASIFGICFYLMVLCVTSYALLAEKAHLLGTPATASTFNNNNSSSGIDIS